jgi:uncharacterized protein (TIGR03492 family)
VTRVLFVSNGHGEIAIASQIASKLQGLSSIACDHLALVGDFQYPSTMHEVGPRKAMPSGGVIAMGNVRNIARDVGAGLIALTLEQLRFVRSVRGTYAVAVAVGDIFALGMAQLARAHSCVFVGTAKSVHVAPYGALERQVIRKADRVFVRDAATAQHLRERGVNAAAGNAIADLYASTGETAGVHFDPLIAIFPGSREPAYEDAVFLARVLRNVGARIAGAGGLLSIAPSIDVQRMCRRLEADGWRVEPRDDARAPFALYDGSRDLLRVWSGSLGAMLQHATIVLGQAGTANEAAASQGVPVVAFARSAHTRTPWYRKRQIGLLGEAICIAPADPQRAADDVVALLHDQERRTRMGAIGRERMGPPGAAAKIAAEVAALAKQV